MLLVPPQIAVIRNNTSYTCSAVKGYPEAQISWELNHELLNGNNDSSKQQGLFQTTSIINGNFHESDSLVCVVAHPVFREAKRYQVNTTGRSPEGKEIHAKCYQWGYFIIQ